jgi:glucose-1-phosphate thymidylyltransferase
MKVIIPMAGLGTRMRPHTFSHPKPLVNVAGQPMLTYLIDLFDGIEVDEWIFIVGYLGDQIETFIDETYDINATYVVQEELIGQAHAIHLAKEHLTGPCFVLFSDTLFETDLSVIQDTDADAIAFVKEVDDPRRFGVVELNAAGVVTRFIEKPDSMDNKNVVIGLYYLKDAGAMIGAIEKQMERRHMTKGEFFLADAFQIMIDDGAVFRTQDVDVWLDCGKPETVLETNRYALEHWRDNSAASRRDGVSIVPPVYIDPTATVERSVIGPYTAISKNAVVHGCVLTNSIVDNDARIENMIIADSLIGKGAVVTRRPSTVNLGEETSAEF